MSQKTELQDWVSEHFHVERWRGDEADIKCKLHDDQHASAGINIESRVWHCQVCQRGGKLSDLASELHLPDLPPFTGNGNGSGKHEVAHYDYHDASGKLLYQIVRFYPKDFRAFNPLTKEWSIKGIERVPYRLPESLRGSKRRQSSGL